MNKRLIYADNAATTRMSPSAMDAMIRFLATDYGNASQPYSFSRSVKKAIKEARSIIADCIGAKPEEIFFTSCGSESDNWVINSATEQSRNIITSRIEHHAIINPCLHAQDKGSKVLYLPVDSSGVVSADAIENYIDSNSLLSVMMANNEIGTIEPIDKYSLISRNKGALFHSDAVQAVGHININVVDLGLDLMSASGHKFNGPKGIGFLYVRDGVKINSFIHGGAQENGLRAGTENVASIMAMAVALRENIDGLDSNQKHLKCLEEVIEERLLNFGIDYVRNGINHLPGLLSLSFKGKNGESLLHRLDLKGICVSTGSACDSKKTQISHVLKSMGLPIDYAKGTIRISLCKYNTMEEAKEIANSIIEILK